MNKKEEALILLLKAYQTFPDSEVAAHLGEVLWALEQKDEAVVIWQTSAQKDPTNKALIDTIKRFIPQSIKSSPKPTNSEETAEPATPPNQATPENTL